MHWSVLYALILCRFQLLCLNVFIDGVFIPVPAEDWDPYAKSAVKIVFLHTLLLVKRSMKSQIVLRAVEALSGLMNYLRWFGRNQPTLSHLPESCLDVMTSSPRPNSKPSSDIYVCIKFGLSFLWN